ncbi:MAG: AAA family ATPase [Sulfuricurvum sp.]|nr:AAA family ATPase [Sulfuricurvum sp.]MDP3023555.1 AAA family ATPase [Sulfuricurvum sp.]
MALTLFKKYHVLDLLHENEESIVYRAKRSVDDLAVIIKMLKSTDAGRLASAQLNQEYQILSNLNGCCIPKIIEVVTLPSQYCIVFEDIGGISLHDILSTRTFELRESLMIAVKVAKTLHYLHQKHIIHADVNPKNIVYNLSTQKVMLIDYGYSVVDNNFYFNTDINVGTSGNLLYMSPEQTGRTKNRIDFRSDLYSFGMTLYHLLSSKAPYSVKNRYELVHKQVALMPQSLDELSPAIPNVVSRIVNKLIAKKPELRYASDESLIHDLEECLRLLNEKNEIPDFTIAMHDGILKCIGERLYGRESQLQLLDKALNRMMIDGPVSVLISGSSGVGKTRLIEEFFAYADLSVFNVLRAKFYSHKVALPYSALKQLMGQLHAWMLTRGAHEQKLNLSVSSSQILSYLFTELKPILHSVRSNVANPIDNLSQKLPFALKELFSSVATQSSPLILFMDNLQWADPESLSLIKKGLLNSNNPYLHIIGSYRNDEGDTQQIQDIFYDKSRLVAIEVAPLLQENITQILEEVLDDNKNTIHKLGALLHAKTLGNPFYFKTLVEELVQKKYIVFEKGHWNYSLDRIKLYSANTNITTIINERFEQLNPQQQMYLCYLALFSSRYAKKFTLTMMHSLGMNNNLIEELASNGFIELTKKEYAFVHDQIQNHVYQSMNNEIKKRIHYKIGHYLLKAFESGEYKECNSAVYHLNHSHNGTKFSKKLFLLNITALQEMVNNGSYIHACKLIRWVDEHLFDEKLWKSQRNDAYAYSQLKCRILYLNGEHDEAVKEIQYLILVSKTIDERVACFRVLKNICVTQGKNFTTLIEAGNALFKELQVNVPSDKPNLENTIAILNDQVRSHPLFLETKKVLSLPLINNSKNNIIASLLIDYWEAAYYLADVSLMQWAYLTIVAQSFVNGNTTESSFGYVLLGGQLASEKNYTKGYAFGDAAIKLNQQLNDKIMLPKVHNFMANFINPYIKPLISNVTYYQKSLHQSKINGDIVFGTWANFLMLFSEYLAGFSLEKFRHSASQNSDFILASGDTKMIAIFNILIQTAASLQEHTQDYAKEEEKAIKAWEEDKFYPALAWYALLKAQICLLRGEFDEGLDYYTKYVHTTANEVVMFPKLRLLFIRALLLMGKKTPLTVDEQELLTSDLNKCESFMKISKKNFKSGRLLLKAERMKGIANTWEVARIYDDAIRAAQESKSSYFVALTALCAYRFWDSMFYSDLSRFYLNEAVVGLNAWGAYEIATHVSGLIPPTQYISSSEIVSSVSSKRSSLKTESANFQSILDSFNAISQTLDSTKLIETLMQTILENATASRAILILKYGNDYYTKATIDFAQGKIEMCGLLLAQYPLIPQSVIQYALNAQQNLILDNPLASDIFLNDPYLQTHKPASCSAIVSSLEGSISAVLYLENESIATPLSSESVRTLELLLTQASIVLKNTLLYESLTKSSEELNKAQELAHLGSWKYNANTEDLEWSAEVYRIYEIEPFSQIIDHEWFIEHVHPDDVALIQNAVQKALNGNRGYNIRHRIITANGNEKIVHQKAQTYWEDDVQKISGTIQDITNSEEAKAEISRLTQVVDQNPFSTIITNTEGVIEYANKQSLIMTGYFEQELIGKKMSIFCSGIHPKEFYTDLWDTITHKQQIWRGTIINKIKNGENIDCSSTIFPILNANREVINFVTIQENVTQRNIKDKLFMMQTRQAQMGEMLSMIAHQWRQPLSVISALMNKQRVNIALEKYTLQGIEQSLGDVDTQVQYLSRTISDFRDFFRPDKEKTLTKSSIIIDKALGLIRHTLKNDKVEIVTDYTNDVSYLTYEHEMIQVFLNLIKNAQDAFKERKIVNPTLTIKSNHQDNMTFITIEDNAGGIDSSVISTLFLPYVSTKNEHNGTGLGLYMSKTIVEEHCQGSLHVENTANGAKFTLSMPTKDSNGTV